MNQAQADCLADLGSEARNQLGEAELAALHGFFSVPRDSEMMEAAFRVRTDKRSRNYGPVQMFNPPAGICLHHTAGEETSDLSTLMYGSVSSNDYITKQAVIYELVPYPRRAWAQGFNTKNDALYWDDGNAAYWSIEIENWGNHRDPYPQVQIDAVVWRCRQLRRKWPSIKHVEQVFRHRDYQAAKVDPSDNFPYAEVRRRIFAATDPTDDSVLPTPEPSFEPRAKYSLVVPNTVWAKKRAQAFVESFGPKIAVVEDVGEAAKVSKFCLDYEKHGAWTTIALGAKSMPMLHPAAKEAMLAHPRTVTDVWSAVDTEQAYASFSRLADLEGAGSLKDDYEKEFGKNNPKQPPKPPPPDKGIDVGDYTPNWERVVHSFFESRNPWGLRYHREDGVEVARVADEKGLDLALALALVEQESFCRRVLGCDHGNVGDRAPYCNQEATRSRVESIVDGGRFSRGMNGIGLTQITYHTYVMQAERMGGAHVPRNQLLVGLDIIVQYLANGMSLDEALGRYNAGSNWRSVYAKYINPVRAKQATWKAHLK